MVETDKSHYQQLLTLASDLLRPFARVPSHQAAKINKLGDIRCVIFDVYGTLLLSDRSPSLGNTNQILLEILDRENISLPTNSPATQFNRFHQQKLLAAKSSGLPSPELDIRKIWRSFLGEQADDAQIQRIALAYECSIHHVWLVPGIKQALRQLSSLQLPLGILSNAQFYTPIILEALLRAPLSEFGFLSTLSFFSYQYGESKPGTLMFQRLIGELDKLNLLPSHTALVGNDPSNDIIPSSKLGLRTILCAFDRRSDRPENSPNTQMTAEATITRAEDLFSLIQ